MDNQEITLIKNYYNIIETNKIVTFLDSENRNVYSSPGYAKLFGLLAQDLCGKSLQQLTDNKYALAMVDIAQRYLRILQIKNISQAKGIIKFTSPSGVQIFAFEVFQFKSLFKIELAEVSTIFIVDNLHILNQAINAKAYQRKVNFPLKKVKKIRPQLNEPCEILLFLLVLGKSYKEIANILSSLYNTNFNDVKVRALIHNNLFHTFEVMSVQELINNYLATKVPYPVLIKLFSTINIDGVLVIDYQ